MSEREKLPLQPLMTESPCDHQLDGHESITIVIHDFDDEEAQICRGTD